MKTGCMNTPKLGSRFCDLHIQNVSVPQHRDPQAGCQEKTSQGGEEGVVAMILGKRDTRSGTYYQVRSTCNSDALQLVNLLRTWLFNVVLFTRWPGWESH